MVFYLVIFELILLARAHTHIHIYGKIDLNSTQCCKQN